LKLVAAFICQPTLIRMIFKTVIQNSHSHGSLKCSLLFSAVNVTGDINKQSQNFRTLNKILQFFVNIESTKEADHNLKIYDYL